jgi:cytochrome b561
MPQDRLKGRYTAIAIFLHWTMAVGIAALVILGLAMAHLTLTPLCLFELYQLHKSIGVTVLLAAFLRLGWRLLNPPPSLPHDMSNSERAGAVTSHLLLYAFLFLLPLTGWMLVSASVFSIPTVLYGVILWPDLPILSALENKALAEAALKIVHAYGAYAFVALITVHAAAAFWHHFIKRDNVLSRMLPIGAHHNGALTETRIEASSS